jgi:cyclic-di-GMP-binding protein
MAKDFSFDIESDFDISELDNALDQARREINQRYDFKGTSAAIEYIPSDRKGVKITGDSQYQLDSILDMFRQKLAKRGVSQKVISPTSEGSQQGMVMVWELLFQRGLDQDKAKKITKLLRDDHPKVKTQIQGETVRVTSASKDELQTVMSLIRNQDYDFPIEFTNYR